MKKLDINTIRTEFKKERYVLMNSIYINRYSNTLKYMCPNNHNGSTSWSRWLRGHRCRKCYDNARKLSIEFVRASFEEEGYTLLSAEYNNANSKLKCKCPNGHIFSMTYGNWYSGRRCTYCNGYNHIDFNYIKKSFENEGYKLLSKKYKKSNNKLKYICPNSHYGTITWNNWQQNKRCFKCAIEYRASLRRVNFNVIKNEFKKENYILLTNEYKNCDQKLDFICPSGHRYSISWNDWKYNNSRCAICSVIKYSGSGNPNWKGGISCEPYCDAWADKEYKESIKERDGYQCLNPYCFARSTRLSIHHIDYNKKNCGPDNLITICISCNSMANKNRDWHKHWYQTLMNKKYKYNYKEV